MSEADAIARSSRGPVTIEMLLGDLRELGVKPGMVLIVHSSLSSLGWVCGGAQAVVMALEEAVGENGTLVVPTGSGSLTDPSGWKCPPVPKSWWETIRENLPAFDLHMTSPRDMGEVPSCLLRQPGSLRSTHPQVSLAAWGRHAETVASGHGIDFRLGEKSPLARVYDLDGWVLLLGVGHDRNTSLHLAEYRASWPSKKRVTMRVPLDGNGKRSWMDCEDFNIDSADFVLIGDAFERQAGRSGVGPVRIGRVGHAATRLMSQRYLVDFGVEWMTNNRD